jgi:ABC-type phosphate transport system substrate-binding protein
MRMLTKSLVAGAAAAVTAVSLTAGPALADPPSGTVPKDTAAVGVGADTTQYLFDQFSTSWNKTHKTGTQIFSWDATNPVTQAQGDQIETKSACATIARPNGGTAGKTALEANATDPTNSKYYCVDYARTASPRSSSDPACSTGGICYVSLAGDAEDWAVRSAANGGSDAPASLTSAQLAKIFECKDTNWKQVGGTSAPIEAYLPQTSAATRTFWLTALGGGTTPITAGSCVSDLPTQSEPGGTLEQNEGYNTVFNSPEAIFIYSVGDYIAQFYHSAACTNQQCTGSPACNPTASQNQFGCNETGYLGLGEISKVAPLTSGKSPAINPNFPIVFQHSLYDVVRYDPNTTDHIPGSESGSPGSINLEQFLGKTGYFCTNAAAKADVKDYGFLPTWKLSSCGAVS